MSVPDGLLYSADHEWVRIDGTTARVGITDYAQDALGDVVFVQAPTVGASVTSGDSFSEVESTKSVSDIYAPVDGVIAAVNDRLDSEPALVNSDPYGDGWLCEITMSSTIVDHLMSPAAYQDLIGHS
ncbi:MAG: glycine cleavage system protein GcvH [Actinomycetota bacterium]|jgi:glycine cleavage system H protein|nr:glycine cleavage system protein GcvH [Actinomycetota bacterium]MDA3011103.1 glycine cleavage system protein GcvH [Actinomycetota bacterium]MDA3023972.1 glycine cleavage system protein GcvH [Actinomycetota bacterium]